ncbi:type II toxin-antitoxin system RelE family toxin [Legionella longbeachae]|uniref:type II toxin-antitoxin system RelE family toxin n=1 Tax=Legionella longbeachae TaxID=450 RepID=UPI0014051A46|nr:type II toxin-antitoxin system mRNA interferase toxin, RelE/StbE family [Legionella longbeachae]QIN30665.1 type II toxin-antitoxin system mRNA interferase toxin, RelE/StbE family [Legionella longbeachae]
MNIFKVILNTSAKKDLQKVPAYIAIKLYGWIEAVAHEGLMEVRKTPGYHDEPLKGKRKGQRSIRLSKGYRAIYEINRDRKMEIIEVIEVNKHDY